MTRQQCPVDVVRMKAGGMTRQGSSCCLDDSKVTGTYCSGSPENGGWNDIRQERSRSPDDDRVS